MSRTAVSGTKEMWRSSRVRPIPSTPQYDKEARFLAQTPKVEAGQVLFPREAPWLAELVRELVEFPNGTHDDQVDSISQALKYLSQKIPTPREVERQAARATRRQRLYRGEIAFKGKVYPGQHEAIVDEALWTAVAERLEWLLRRRMGGIPKSRS
jgi:hypothetical protein